MLKTITRSILLLALALMLAGCSFGRQTFRSTVHSPKTVMIRDTTTHKTIWVKEIPVDHTMTTDMNRPGDYPPLRISTMPATSMSWEIKNARSGMQTEHGTVELPGTPVQIFMALRPSPEQPAEYAAPTEDLTPSYVVLPYGDTFIRPKALTSEPVSPQTSSRPEEPVHEPKPQPYTQPELTPAPAPETPAEPGAEPMPAPAPATEMNAPEPEHVEPAPEEPQDDARQDDLDLMDDALDEQP